MKLKLKLPASILQEEEGKRNGKEKGTRKRK